jgi:hypothetical protein
VIEAANISTNAKPSPKQAATKLLVLALIFSFLVFWGEDRVVFTEIYIQLSLLLAVLQKYPLYLKRPVSSRDYEFDVNSKISGVFSSQQSSTDPTEARRT